MDVLALDRRWRWIFVGCLFALVSAGAEGQVALAQKTAPADGEVLPVTVLVDQVYSQFSGRILRLELSAPEDGGAATYDVKFLGAGGDVMILSYDARSLELLGLSGRAAPADRHQAGTAAIEMLQNRIASVPEDDGDDGDDSDDDGDDDGRDGDIDGGRDNDGRDGGSDDDRSDDDRSDDDGRNDSDDGRDNSGPGGGGSDDGGGNSGPGGGDD